LLYTCRTLKLSRVVAVRRLTESSGHVNKIAVQKQGKAASEICLSMTFHIKKKKNERLNMKIFWDIRPNIAVQDFQKIIVIVIFHFIIN
jgi:hypothetical protein